MRDYIIMAIVCAAAIVALARPWIGVLNWTWLSIMNPHRYAWGFAYTMPVAMIAAVSTIIGLIFTKDKRWPFRGAPVYWLAIFTFWITLSWQMGMDPEAQYPLWDKVIKIYFMTFVALMLISTKTQILAFAWVTIGSMAALAAKGGLFTIITAGNYRVWGPPESFIADNNDFALATVTTVPMIYFLRELQTKRWFKHALTGVMLLAVAAALGSHSRGALLALIGMATWFWLSSKNKGATAALILFAAILFLPMLPAEWWARMSTISSYQQDQSALGRINAWIVAWETAKHYFFGGGMTYQVQSLFDSYGVYETEIRAAHSVYFQVLGNHGFVGLALYLLLWWSVFRCAGKLRKAAHDIPQAKWAADLGAMVQVSIAGFSVGGAFLSLPYFDLPYNFMVLVVVASDWLARRGWETDLSGAPAKDASPTALEPQTPSHFGPSRRQAPGAAGGSGAAPRP